MKHVFPWQNGILESEWKIIANMFLILCITKVLIQNTCFRCTVLHQKKCNSWEITWFFKSTFLIKTPFFLNFRALCVRVFKKTIFDKKAKRKTKYFEFFLTDNFLSEHCRECTCSIGDYINSAITEKKYCILNAWIIHSSEGFLELYKYFYY